MPVFDHTGQFAGAVASDASRITPDHRQRTLSDLFRAGHAITRNWGGVVPVAVQTLWDATQKSLDEKAGPA